MPQLIDLTGRRFGRLVVIERVSNCKSGQVRWLCQCNCGNKIIVYGNNLRNDRTKSCGCLNKEVHTKHSHARRGKETKIYYIWQQMVQRCINPNNKKYPIYGSRGIKVCKRWLKFKNFNEDMGESWKLGLTIERKNNNKGYYLGNCCWATRKQQNRNTRRNHLITYNRKTQCIAAWAEEIGISYKVLYNRICQYCWLPEKALTSPVRERGKNGRN